MGIIEYKNTTISFDDTHHLSDGIPIYKKKFNRVMSFHPPGIAAVLDDNTAYHIDIHGEPIYSKRFIKTFGYYQGLAAVIGAEGWYHINLKGNALYTNRYDWVGNFQENRCSVKEDGNYFHIDNKGSRVSTHTYRYTGDFKYGIAVAYKTSKLATHIDLDGNEIHGKMFEELGIFHKGFACAKDSEGYFHIKKDGKPLYPQRYLWCEPFYNEKAFARSKDNILGIISENGVFQSLEP